MLEPYGLDDRVRALLNSETLNPTTQLARVTRLERDRTALITDTGETTRPWRGGLAVGDWVAIDDHRIVSVALRWSSLMRTDPGSVGRSVDHAQVLAANVDVVFVVEPLDKPPRVSRLDRALAVVWESGAVPVVVLTKADLHPDSGSLVDRLTVELRGVDVVATSVVDGRTDGVPRVASFLQPCRTGVVLGLSGAGKSSLLNALAGQAIMPTGEVRAEDRRGRHTTTTRQLVALPGGGVLIDLPGLRSMGMWDAADGVRAVFDDIEALAQRCRFGDCAHDSEPACAVRAAIDAGVLDDGRLRRWRKLAREAQAAERRQNPALDAAHRAEIRRQNRSRRANPHNYRKR